MTLKTTFKYILKVILGLFFGLLTLLFLSSIGKGVGFFFLAIISLGFTLTISSRVRRFITRGAFSSTIQRAYLAVAGLVLFFSISLLPPSEPAETTPKQPEVLGIIDSQQSEPTIKDEPEIIPQTVEEPKPEPIVIEPELKEPEPVVTPAKLTAAAPAPTAPAASKPVSAPKNTIDHSINYDCGDFKTWEEANTVYQDSVAIFGNDKHGLDGRGPAIEDGIPCESLR